MELNINLNNQRNKRTSKRNLRIYSAITLGLSATIAVTLAFDLSGSRILLWFYMFYFLMFAVSLFIQSNGKHLLDLLGKSYFKIDDWGIECKIEMFNSKVVKVARKDIDDMKIRLFEVDLKVGDEWRNINLEKLSDDNLKIVNQYFKKCQQHILDMEKAVGV